MAGQFKILQHRLEILFDNSILYTKNNEYVIHEDDAPETFQEFKRCVEHHRMLIDYVDELERIFAMATLCQLLMSSVMLCVVGFQVFVVRSRKKKKEEYIYIYIKKNEKKRERKRNCNITISQIIYHVR